MTMRYICLKAPHIMKRTLVNLALVFGSIGFIGYILMIIASFLGCCAGINTVLFHRILLFILAAAFLVFFWCAWRNYCQVRDERRSQLEG